MPQCPSTSTRRCRTRAQVPKYSKVFFGVVSPVGSWPVTGVTSSNLQWQLMPRNWTRCRSVPGNSQYTSNSGDCWSWLQMPLTHQCQIADMHRPLRVFQCRSWFLLGSWEAWIYIYIYEYITSFPSSIFPRSMDANDSLLCSKRLFHCRMRMLDQDRSFRLDWWTGSSMSTSPEGN